MNKRQRKAWSRKCVNGSKRFLEGVTPANLKDFSAEFSDLHAKAVAATKALNECGKKEWQGV